MIWINDDIQDYKIYILIEITTLLLSKFEKYISKENELCNWNKNKNSFASIYTIELSFTKNSIVISNEKDKLKTFTIALSNLTYPKMKNLTL